MKKWQNRGLPGLVEVPIGSLRRGMFVAELDRPWLDTPFAIQGFHIQNPADIDILQRYCSVVYVDPSRSNAQIPIGLVTLPGATKDAPSVGLRSEFERAKVDFQSAKDVIADVFGRLREGGELNIERVATALNPLIESVLRNHNALAILARVKEQSGYTYGHSIACAVWAAILGRHLALDKRSLECLVLGSALIDVGKVRLPEALLNKQSALSPEEIKLMRSHVRHSVSLIRESGDVSPEVLATVEFHHERWNGSGYPEGRSGTDIPLLARIAGLVDSYDAMLTPRPWAVSRGSFEAIQELRDLADEEFQGQLIEQFTAAIGLFPTGSIVELNTGEVGIVTRQNPTRRLKPEIVLVLDAKKQRREKYEVVNLMTDGQLAEAQGGRWILKELPRGSHGVNAEDYYI